MENASIINDTTTGSINTNSPLTFQKRKVKGNDLDKDAFLKLLVTELRHQDPTQPMENKEFIAQMAQFSALEQMTNVNKSIQTLNKNSMSGEAFSLLGKNIQAMDPVSGMRVEGKVSSLFYRGDEIRLVVNNKDVGLSDIYAVFANSEPGQFADKSVIENNKKENITTKDISNIIDINK